MTISHEAADAPVFIEQNLVIKRPSVWVALDPRVGAELLLPDFGYPPLVGPVVVENNFQSGDIFDYSQAHGQMRPATREAELLAAKHRAVMEIVNLRLPPEEHHASLVAIDEQFAAQYDTYIQGRPQTSPRYWINLEPNSPADPPAQFQLLAAGFLLGINGLAAKVGGRKALQALLAFEIAVAGCTPRSAPIPFPESPAREAPTPQSVIIDSALLASLRSGPEGGAFNKQAWIEKIFPAQLRAIRTQFDRATVEAMQLGIFEAKDPTTTAPLGYAFELRDGGGNSYLFVGGDENGNGGFWVRVPGGAAIDQKGGATVTFRRPDGHYEIRYRNLENTAVVDPETGMMTGANVPRDKFDAVDRFVTDHLPALRDFTRTKTAKEGDPRAQFQLRGRYDEATGEFYAVIQVITGKGEEQLYVLGPDGKIRQRIPPEGHVYRLNSQTGAIEAFTKDGKLVGPLTGKDQALAKAQTPTPPPTETKAQPTALATKVEACPVVDVKNFVPAGFVAGKIGPADAYAKQYGTTFPDGIKEIRGLLTRTPRSNPGVFTTMDVKNHLITLTNPAGDKLLIPYCPDGPSKTLFEGVSVYGAGEHREITVQQAEAAIASKVNTAINVFWVSESEDPNRPPGSLVKVIVSMWELPPVQ